MLGVALAVVYGLLAIAVFRVVPIRIQNRSRFDQARAP
jgi:hypothetical protein